MIQYNNINYLAANSVINNTHTFTRTEAQLA